MLCGFTLGGFKLRWSVVFYVSTLQVHTPSGTSSSRFVFGVGSFPIFSFQALCRVFFFGPTAYSILAKFIDISNMLICFGSFPFKSSSEGWLLAAFMLRPKALVHEPLLMKKIWLTFNYVTMLRYVGFIVLRGAGYLQHSCFGRRH